MHLYFSNIKQRNQGHNNSRIDLGTLLIRTRWYYQAKLDNRLHMANAASSESES